MKLLKKLLKGIVYTIIGIVILVNLIIVFSGRYYIYKAIPNTIFKGRFGPGIDEYRIFANRKVETGKPQPWPIASDYNKKSIPDTSLSKIRGFGTIAFLIVKNDSLRYEQYWEGHSDTSHTNSFSMAKSITSILTGIAIEEGKIKSVDEKVSDFIPEYKQGMDSLLRIKDLLTMSSGINFDESYISPFAYPAEAYYGTQLIKTTLGYKVTSTPGKEFIYLSGNSTLLGYIVTKATGKKLAEYASEKLWQPLGAEYPAYWGLDHKGGMEKAYCCFNSNARDFARIGQLYLDSGKWHGVQLIPKDYVLASIKPEITAYYGYNWWILSCEGHIIPYCRGILGQYIFVIPDLKMVVVRLGRKRGPVETTTIDGKEYNIPTDALVYLEAALQMYRKN